MAKASSTYSIALIVTCAFLMAVPGLAASSDQTKMLLPPLFGHDKPAIEKCLSTFKSVHGCVEEVITSFLSHRVQLIGSAHCCKTFNEVDDKCWPKVFPFNPFFPPLVKDHCAQILKNASPSASLN